MAERDWIKRYFAPIATAEGADGLRDDVAVLHGGADLIITNDALVEGVHFLSDDPIDTIARKLVRVNVSDIIASGGLPTEAVLILGWNESRGEDALATFADAFGAELAAWNISLLGGDTVSAPRGLFLALTLIGRPVGNGVVRRSGAKTADDIWVSGVIGAGALGLEAARAGEMESPFLKHYREPGLPAPSIATLVSRHAHAAMDVSDGLLADLKMMAGASGLQAAIALEEVPFAIETDDLDEQFRLATGGDDYQALFSACAKDRAEITAFAAETGLKLTRIGAMQAGEGLLVTKNGRRVNLPETLGFEHG